MVYSAVAECWWLKPEFRLPAAPALFQILCHHKDLWTAVAQILSLTLDMTSSDWINLHIRKSNQLDSIPAVISLWSFQKWIIILFILYMHETCTVVRRWAWILRWHDTSFEHIDIRNNQHDKHSCKTCRCTSIAAFQSWIHSRKYTAGSIQVANTVVEPVLRALTPWGTEGTEGGRNAKALALVSVTSSSQRNALYLSQIGAFCMCPHHQKAIHWAEYWMVQRSQHMPSLKYCTVYQGSG